MNNKQQAAAELKRFAVQLRGILAIADDIDSLGAMEQTQLDLEDKAKQLRNAILLEEKRLADAKEKVIGAEKAYLARVAQMEADAAKWRENAEAIITKMKSDAAVAASERVATAEAQASAIRREVEKAQKELDRLNESIKKAQATYSGVSSQLKELVRNIPASAQT